MDLRSTRRLPRKVCGGVSDRRKYNFSLGNIVVCNGRVSYWLAAGESPPPDDGQVLWRRDALHAQRLDHERTSIRETLADWYDVELCGGDEDWWSEHHGHRFQVERKSVAPGAPSVCFPRGQLAALTGLHGVVEFCQVAYVVREVADEVGLDVIDFDRDLWVANAAWFCPTVRGVLVRPAQHVKCVVGGLRPPVFYDYFGSGDVELALADHFVKMSGAQYWLLKLTWWVAAHRCEVFIPDSPHDCGATSSPCGWDFDAELRRVSEASVVDTSAELVELLRYCARG